MPAQIELQFRAEADLTRFNIPHHGKHVCYGDVSRRLHALSKSGCKELAAELALVAGELFKEPYWAQRYGAQGAAAQKGQ